jgi:hypothetical protein
LSALIFLRRSRKGRRGLVIYDHVIRLASFSPPQFVVIAFSESFLKAPRADDIAALEIPGLSRASDSFTGVEVGGLIYPSVATSANDDNIVFKCSIADNCLTFVWAHYLEISRTTDKADEFTPKGLDFAGQMSSSDEIQWIGHFPNTLVPGADLRFDADENGLMLKDSLNRIIGRFTDPTTSSV